MWNFDFVILSFFALMHNSKTVRCTQIISTPHDCSTIRDTLLWARAACELRSASCGFKHKYIAVFYDKPFCTYLQQNFKNYLLYEDNLPIKPLLYYWRCLSSWIEKVSLKYLQFPCLFVICFVFSWLVCVLPISWLCFVLHK